MGESVLFPFFKWVDVPLYKYIYIYINTEQNKRNKNKNKKTKKNKQTKNKTKKSSPIFDHFLERHECVCGCFCLLFYFLFSLYDFLQMRLCANARQVKSKGWINTSQNEIYIEGFQTKGKDRMCHRNMFWNTILNVVCCLVSNSCPTLLWPHGL